jgi:uncharacterized spore protein YtfJ
MSDKNDIQIESFDEYSPANANPAGETFENIINGFLSVADVEAVFGAPVKQRDTIIIPAAEVTAVLGFGLGMGSDVGGEDGKKVDSGAGGGGGGSSASRPVAVIISDAQGVRVEPIFDLTKIALAGVTAAAFAFGMLARLRNLRRNYEAIERKLR